MPKNHRIFCTLYKHQTEEAFDDAVEAVMAQAADEGRIPDDASMADMIGRRLETARDTWLVTPQAELGGQSPEAYVDALDDGEDIARFVRITATELDEALPADLIRRMKAKQALAEEPLIEMAREGHGVEVTEDDGLSPSLLPAIRAAEILGIWGVPTERTGILADYLAADMPSPHWSEAVQAYLKQLGNRAVTPILDAMAGDRADRETDDVLLAGDTEDYLLTTLTAIGQDQPDDRIYACLRERFKRRDAKMIPVICLGDYGDPRAVTLLRHYLLQDAATVEEATYYEIISAIRRLGGKTEDLPDPFSDTRGARR